MEIVIAAAGVAAGMTAAVARLTIFLT